MRRQKPIVVRRTPPPRRVDSAISTISRYTDDTTLERHLSALEAMRTPIRTGPPPYCEQQNRAYTPERGGGGGSSAVGASTSGVTGAQTGSSSNNNHSLPPDEPPPPYDAVIKPGGNNNNQRNNPRDSERENQRNQEQEQSAARDSGPRLNTVLPSLGEPTQQQQPAPALPPLPDDRPPISPSGGRTLPRIRLGTTPLHQQHPRPKNYMNQNPGAPQYPPLGVPLNYMNYDTDGDNSSVDHIYETLNLPDSRPQTPRATAPTTSAPSLPSGGRGYQQAGAPKGTGGQSTYRPQNYYPPPISQHLQMTNLSNLSSPGVGRGLNSPRGVASPSRLHSRPHEFNSTNNRGPNAGVGLGRGPLSHHNGPISPNQNLNGPISPNQNRNGPMSPNQNHNLPQNQGLLRNSQSSHIPLSSLSQNPQQNNNNPVAPVPNTTRTTSYPQLARNNAMPNRGSSGRGYRPPVGGTSSNNNYRDEPEINNPPHSRTSSNLTSRSRTPDSQCHLLPASNNSSFDNTTPPHSHKDQHQMARQADSVTDHPRQDSGTSVVFSNLEDNLLPTTVWTSEGYISKYELRREACVIILWHL